LKDLDPAIKSNPKDEKSLATRAEVNVKLGKKEAALTDYNSLIEIKTTDPKLFFRRAILLSELGKDDEALRDFSKTIEMNPNDSDSLLERARIYTAKGDYQRSIDDLTKALQVKPADLNAVKKRAEVYRKLNKHSQAAKDYAQAINLDPSATNIADLYYNLGESLLQAKEFDYAIKAFTKTIQLDPKKGLAYANRGVAFKDKGDLGAAVTDFKASISLLEKKTSRDYVSKLLGEVENRLKTDAPKGLIDKVLEIFQQVQSPKPWPGNLW
jgi:tetratricopeptide (TPR) repeat protein